MLDSDALGSPRSPLGAWIVDRQGTLLGFDEGLESLTGWPSVEVVGRDNSMGGHPGGPFYEGEIPAELPAAACEFVLRCRDGRRIGIESEIERLAGPGERVLVRVLRVLPAPQRERALAQDLDLLTGLPGAAWFENEVGAEFAASCESTLPLAVILVDIDHLREVNDERGRADGDRVLQEVSRLLVGALPPAGRAARLGNDDFAAILPAASRGEARHTAARVRSAVERHRFFGDPAEGPVPRVTVSVGAASYPADTERAADLLDRAADALEEARAMGRNRVWCYLRRPRVPVAVPVYFDGADPLLVGWSRDLSPSGIFVQTSALIDIGMRCAFTFPLPGQSTRIHVVGRVVRSVPTDSSDARPRVPGIGVEFQKFSGTTDRRAIETYVHLNESRTLRPESGALSL